MLIISLCRYKQKTGQINRKSRMISRDLAKSLLEAFYHKKHSRNRGNINYIFPEIETIMMLNYKK